MSELRQDDEMLFDLADLFRLFADSTRVRVLNELRKKELTKEKEEKIVGRAFMVLLALVVIVTILDIFRLIG